MAVSNPVSSEAAHGDGVPLAGIARSLEPLIRAHAAALEEGHIPPWLLLPDQGPPGRPEDRRPAVLLTERRRRAPMS